MNIFEQENNFHSRKRYVTCQEKTLLYFAHFTICISTALKFKPKNFEENFFPTKTSYPVKSR